MILQNQLSMAEIFSDCQDILDSDKPEFLSLLEKHIDLNRFIPLSFKDRFYLPTGRPRQYSLVSMLWALIIQRILSIPTDALLLTFLRYSRHLREFCGFSKVPDASKITRFKQDFCDELQVFFDSLVDLTEPVCCEIDPVKAGMLIYDSTGIEAYVTENNPKFLNSLILRLKRFAHLHDLNDSYDPYKAAYASMPSASGAEPGVKQQYVNGHFCYAYKAGILTNGLGIIRALDFYDEEYFKAHPEIVRQKKSDSPDEDKSVSDTRLLLPSLKDFFTKHPDVKPHVFIGDAAFDSTEIYKALLTGDAFGENRHFSRAYIPLNGRASLENADYTINEDGIPCCPHDPNLPMRQEGNTSHLRCGIPTFKFVCPRMTWDMFDDGRTHRVCHCENPCTDSRSGRMVYVYPEKELRTYPGTVRGTDDWNETYRIRTTVERSIEHLKDNFCIGTRKTRDPGTLHADLLLCGITQLITVILADCIHMHKYIRSIKSLAA